MARQEKAHSIALEHSEKAKLGIVSLNNLLFKKGMPPISVELDTRGISLV
jgi:hypothetical protein